MKEFPSCFSFLFSFFLHQSYSSSKATNMSVPRSNSESSFDEKIKDGAHVDTRVVEEPNPYSLTDEITGQKVRQKFYGEDHIFKDPTVAEHYRKVYNKAVYEGRNHFDPEFTWTRK